MIRTAVTDGQRKKKEQENDEYIVKTTYSEEQSRCVIQRVALA